jgi:hypothetical protein
MDNRYEGFDAEDWRQRRMEEQARRAARLPGRQGEILALRETGHSVVRLTEYHFRIDGALDLYPTRRRFHDLRTGKRGTYGRPAEALARMDAAGLKSRRRMEVRSCFR